MVHCSYWVRPVRACSAASTDSRPCTAGMSPTPLSGGRPDLRTLRGDGQRDTPPGGQQVTDDAGPTTAPGDDVVELRLPADGAYLSVLRTATAGLAARLDFTLDEIEDLRIAVDEACALLLPDAVPDATMTCL